MKYNIVILNVKALSKKGCDSYGCMELYLDALPGKTGRIDGIESSVDSGFFKDVKKMFCEDELTWLTWNEDSLRDKILFIDCAALFSGDTTSDIVYFPPNASISLHFNDDTSLKFVRLSKYDAVGGTFVPFVREAFVHLAERCDEQSYVTNSYQVVVLDAAKFPEKNDVSDSFSFLFLETTTENTGVIKTIERSADPELFSLLESTFREYEFLWNGESLRNRILFVDLEALYIGDTVESQKVTALTQPDASLTIQFKDGTSMRFVRIPQKCTISSFYEAFIREDYASMLDRKLKKTYHLMTLNAEELLKALKESDEKEEHDEAYGQASYLDIEDGQIISSVDLFENNAMFHQLEAVLRKNNESWNSDLLLEHMVFIDFDGVFTSLKEEEKKSEKNAKRSQEKENKLQNLFEYGVRIAFRDREKPVWFLPFDKSASMSRTSRISFVDASIKKELDRRLLLDLDFGSIQTSPSKLYAYRGLYLSAASRIERNETLVFDTDKVIVIPDPTHNVRDAKGSNILLFGDTDPDETKKREGSNELNGMLWKLGEYAEKEVKITPFDGEGFISLAYAREINRQLPLHYGFAVRKKTESCPRSALIVNEKLGGHCNSVYLKAASSYQIRMPFTKGVLHAVDFKSFLNEYIGETGELWITDVFGISRDLRKAEIILTKSMFKCKDWLQDILKLSGHNGDPMEYYFAKMREYDHALYVGNTDVVLESSGEIKMNYQFLNTLDMQPEDFERIVDAHLEKLDTVREDLVKQERVKYDTNALASATYDSNTLYSAEEDMTGDSRVEQSHGAAWLTALSKNYAFSSDPKVSGMISGTKNSLLTSCAVGRLIVEGECRFLSCDLLELLVQIIKKIHKKPNTDKELLKETDLRGELSGIISGENKTLTLYADRFFIAEPIINLKPNIYYGLLRNPHLSRNEQCALRPYLPVKNSPYRRYLSHLSGVVMVSMKSLVPMALSGADFDGDLVKIVADQTIVNAILRGSYREGTSERKLPVIMIPSVGQKKETDKGTIPYDTVKNTFDNQIGLISNMAIQLGKNEALGKYFVGVESEERDYNISTPACTVVTGLEIDAAKTGVHPTENIRVIRQAIGKDYGDYFLRTKDIITSMPHFLEVENRKGVFVFSYPRAKSKKSEQSKDGNEEQTSVRFTRVKPYLKVESSVLSNLDRLPLAFAERKLKEQNQCKAQKGKDNTQSTDLKFFTFQDENWKIGLNAELKDELKELVAAYCDILSIASQIYNAQKKFSEAKFKGCVVHLLKLQYDSLDVLLPESGCTIQYALDAAYACLDEHFHRNLDNPEDAVERMRKALNNLCTEEWQLTRKEDRVETAKRILGMEETQTGEMQKGFFELISNFNHYGFKLLYYLLKDTISMNLKDASPEIVRKHDKKLDKKIESLAKRKYSSSLYAAYTLGASRMESKKIWQSRLISQCRAYMNDLFQKHGIDLQESPKYIFALRGIDKNAWFFWDILSPELILEYVIYNPDGSVTGG